MKKIAWMTLAAMAGVSTLGWAACDDTPKTVTFGNSPFFFHSITLTGSQFEFNDRRGKPVTFTCDAKNKGWLVHFVDPVSRQALDVSVSAASREFLDQDEKIARTKILAIPQKQMYPNGKGSGAPSYASLFPGKGSSLAAIGGVEVTDKQSDRNILISCDESLNGSQKMNISFRRGTSEMGRVSVETTSQSGAAKAPVKSRFDFNTESFMELAFQGCDGK